MATVSVDGTDNKWTHS